VATTSAQEIPREIWGKWVVRRVLPAGTISCWGDTEARKLLGTEIEYSAEFFRWKDVTIKNPAAEATFITANQLHDDNSGKGTNSSQVTFRQLGIKVGSSKQIKISHPPANITGATSEIPGDLILVKDRTTIVISACNVYFEAKRASVP
jgi:hypothetical protein